jgi:hypothetical protein
VVAQTASMLPLLKESMVRLGSRIDVAASSEFMAFFFGQDKGNSSSCLLEWPLFSSP